MSKPRASARPPRARRVALSTSDRHSVCARRLPRARNALSVGGTRRARQTRIVARFPRASGRCAAWHAGCSEDPRAANPTRGAIMTKTIRIALAFLGVAAGGGCAHETTTPPAAARAEYRIGREDVVTVEVWKDPALSAKVPVRPDGKISRPMV